jgi:methyl-accepting chemotaxis protein
LAQSWTFGKKLGAAFGIVVLLTVGMGATSYYALQVVVAQKDRVITHHAQNLADSLRMLAAMEGNNAGVRGYLLTGEDRYRAGAEADSVEFQAALARVLERDLTSEARQLGAEIGASRTAHQGRLDEVLALRQSEADTTALLASFRARVAPAFDALEAQVDAFAARQERLMEEVRLEADESAARAIAVITGLVIAAVALALGIGVFLNRTLNRQIGTSVQHVRSSSAELQATATQQASAAKEQATAMSEISTTMGELLATSRQIADSARDVAKIAADTAAGATTGKDSVRDARLALDGIREQVGTIVQHMLDLGKKSQRIGGILEIINELAEQTNILAINATIEAAGAGEAGRRFAVVGDEIRKLADRVGSSTKEIRELIEEVRAAVNTTVMATETGSKAVEAGAERFAELAKAFESIGELVDTTTGAAREIELSTKQQTTAVEQVNVAIANTAQATREAEAGSGQTLQTASQLAALSDNLARLIQSQPAIA